MIYRRLFPQDVALIFRRVLLLAVLQNVALGVFYVSSWNSTKVLRGTSANDTLIIRLNEPGRMYTATASILHVNIYGCITFGEPYVDLAPTSLPWNTIPVISPYWTNSLISDRELRVGKASDSNTLKQFSDDVGLAFPAFNRTSSFSNIYIATWSSNKAISFQCALSVSQGHLFAVLQYENSKQNNSLQSGVIGFDDGHDNYWSPNINTAYVANTVGNLPLHSIRGKYVLDLKKSACSPSEWSSNDYCSFNEKCVANNYDENCEGCLVSQSRFTKSQLQCSISFHRTPSFYVVITAVAVLLIIITILVIVFVIKYKRKHEGNYNPQADGNVNYNEYDIIQNLSDESGKLKRCSQESSRARSFYRQSAESSQSLVLGVISPQLFSPKVDDKSPAVTLSWIVGKKPMVIKIHELTFDFPADCLKQESRIGISVRRYIQEKNSVYVYTIFPHDLLFDKPVTVRLNSKWKDPNSASLQKRRPGNETWITVGKFAKDGGVIMNEFCDLCPIYERKTKSLGKGFSYHNILVIAQRDRENVTVVVYVLADMCSDTLFAQCENWKENAAGSSVCGISSEEIALYEEGTLDVDFDAGHETLWRTWKEFDKGRDFRPLKQLLCSRRKLQSFSLRPVGGYSVEEAISQSPPFCVNVKFTAKEIEHTDEAHFTLAFGERLRDKDLRAAYLAPNTGSETRHVENRLLLAPPTLHSPAPPTLHSQVVNFPPDDERINTSMVANDIFLRAIFSLVNERWKKLANILCVEGKDVEVIQSMGCDDVKKCQKAVRLWIGIEGERATVGNLIGNCQLIKITAETIQEKFRSIQTHSDA